MRRHAIFAPTKILHRALAVVTPRLGNAFGLNRPVGRMFLHAEAWKQTSKVNIFPGRATAQSMTNDSNKVEYCCVETTPLVWREV